MAGKSMFQFVKDAYNSAASKKKPEDSERQKQLDGAIKQAEGHTENVNNPDRESNSEDRYETTDEGMRRKRKTADNPAGIQF